MQFLKDHWPWIAGLVVTVIASIVNRFGDPDGDPKTPSPKWVRVLSTIADVLAWVPKPGNVGVLGPVNLPGVPSVSKEPK